MSDNLKEREAFEAWAKSVIASDPQQWPILGGHDGEDYWAYLGFKAGRASVAEAAQSLPDVDALTDKIASMLGGTYHCTRVWSAWHVGTMSQDDFDPVDESETPREIAEEIHAMLAAFPAQPVQPSEPVDTARPDLNKFAYEHHWQRPDGSIYCVDSSD